MTLYQLQMSQFSKYFLVAILVVTNCGTLYANETCADLFASDFGLQKIIKVIHPTQPGEVTPPAEILRIWGPNGPFLIRRHLIPGYPRISLDQQYQSKTFVARKALLLTHHDWNSGTKSTFPEAEKQIEKFLQAGFPVVSLLNSLDGKAGVDRGAYPKGTEKTESFFYMGDVHLLSFRVDDLYMTGGDLTACLNNSLKAVLLNSKVKRIHLLMKATYSVMPEYWRLRGQQAPFDKPFGWLPVENFTYHFEDLNSLPKAIQNLDGVNYPPDFVARIIKANRTNDYTDTMDLPSGLSAKIHQDHLANTLKDLNDEELFQFFREGIFGNSMVGMPYNSQPRSAPEGISYTIRVFKGSQFLGVIGKGQNKIDLILNFN